MFSLENLQSPRETAVQDEEKEEPERSSEDHSQVTAEEIQKYSETENTQVDIDNEGNDVIKSEDETEQKNDEIEETLNKRNIENQSTAENEIADINLQDPEVEKAATKIQSGYKGFKTRKELQQKRQENEQKDEGLKPEIVSEKHDEAQDVSVKEDVQEKQIFIGSERLEQSDASDATKIQSTVKEEIVDIDLGNGSKKFPPK